MNSQSPHFNYTTLPNNVIFGHGRLAELKHHAENLGQRALILTTPHQIDLANQVAQLLGQIHIKTYTKAAQHVPYEIVQEAVTITQQNKIDLLIAPGGGSTIGLAKGVALETNLPILAIPTTYAGSEMTHIWGISKNGRKTTGRNPIVKPKTVIYDPQLILTLPPAFSLTSGINAMAHAVEALYATNANPITNIMAEESIHKLATSLPDVIANPQNINARATSLYGAWLAASVLDMVGMALHHKLCHTLGGSFSMPHAETHTVILPYALSYNQSHIPQAISTIARALNCDQKDTAGTIQDISRHNGGPISLKELGFKKEDIASAAEIATQNPYYNPRPITTETIQNLITQAFYGARPIPI